MVKLACSIGQDLGMKEIRLDAMSQELRDWYRDDTGFVELGKEFEYDDQLLGHMIPYAEGVRTIFPLEPATPFFTLD